MESQCTVSGISHVTCHATTQIGIAARCMSLAASVTALGLMLIKAQYAYTASIRVVSVL